MSINAAQYLRASTSAQDFSTHVQDLGNRAYAELNDMVIVKTYRDEARSGVTISRRQDMQQLMLDVQDKERGFDVLLVRDVTRWGRFQDVDESAYWEFHCKRHGVRVIYVAEPFGDSLSLIGAVHKHMKRVAAAEYSYDLAVKTMAGKVNIVRSGFAACALPSLGYRRMSVTAQGEDRRILAPKERKGSLTDRVRWVLASPEEVAEVRQIFSHFVAGVPMAHIARNLQVRGVLSHDHGPMTTIKVRTLLLNEVFAGVYAWGVRRSRACPTNIPRLTEPITTSKLAPAIIERSVWDAAQERFRKQAAPYRKSDSTA